METLNSNNFWPAMHDLMHNCRHDDRLTPLTQLVYRVLIDLANCNHWAQPFIATDSELQNVTGITSRETITRIKQQLKNLNYIDYNGKPSKYFVYRPPVHTSVQQSVHSATPQTPQFKTSKLQDKTKKEKINKEKEGFDHDPHLRDTQQPTNGADLAKQRYNAILSKLGANG